MLCALDSCQGRSKVGLASVCGFVSWLTGRVRLQPALRGGKHGKHGRRARGSGQYSEPRPDFEFSCRNMKQTTPASATYCTVLYLMLVEIGNNKVQYKPSIVFVHGSTGDSGVWPGAGAPLLPHAGQRCFWGPYPKAGTRPSRSAMGMSTNRAESGRNESS